MKFAEQKIEELRLAAALAKEAEKSLDKGLPREAVHGALMATQQEYATPEQEG